MMDGTWGKWQPPKKWIIRKLLNVNTLLSSSEVLEEKFRISRNLRHKKNPFSFKSFFSMGLHSVVMRKTWGRTET